MIAFIILSGNEKKGIDPLLHTTYIAGTAAEVATSKNIEATGRVFFINQNLIPAQIVFLINFVSKSFRFKFIFITLV